jgi:hypothetical protein
MGTRGCIPLIITTAVGALVLLFLVSLGTWKLVELIGAHGGTP